MLFGMLYTSQLLQHLIHCVHTMLLTTVIMLLFRLLLRQFAVIITCLYVH